MTGRDNVGRNVVAGCDGRSQKRRAQKRRAGAVRRALLTAAAAGVLAGCSLLPPQLRPRPPAHQQPQAQHHAPPAAAGVPSSGSAAAAARLHPLPTAAPAAVTVVGLSQDAVRRLLGPPATEASQGPGRTWTYDGAGCRVEIAFFYDVTRSGFFALSARRPEGGDAQDCLARIHDARDS